MITAYETPTGFTVRAEETEESRGDRFGFTFQTFSPVNPYLALREIRDKIRRRLATRYSRWRNGRFDPTHDELVGVIDHSSEEDETVLQVDGDKVTMEEVGLLLSAYQGFESAITVREQ